jgi:DNA-binding MarR family transcriptional regulator
MADEEFTRTGLSPSHAFLLLLVIDTPGCGPQQLARQLHLAASTVTRLVDALVRKQLVERRATGKTIQIHATEVGHALSAQLNAAWQRLYEHYSDCLGEIDALSLTRKSHEARLKLDHEL